MSDGTVKRDFRKPRIVIELQDDGTLMAEFYVNGARCREYITRGLEAQDLRNYLAVAADQLAATRKREAETEAAQAAALHRRNYFYAAHARHLGVECADRVITRPAGVRTAKPAAGAAGSPKAIPADESVL
jgi:hypothetical protein